MPSQAKLSDYGYLLDITTSEDISWAQSVYLRFIDQGNEAIEVEASRVGSTNVEYTVPQGLFNSVGTYRMFLIVENDAIPRRLTSEQMTLKII